ncbi:MAG: glycosyl transferase, group 1 [Parcubacteria group bacterium Licking1014_1]|nr:MAG: glycosyl transferase, group 1 [Parcubacteria group bacterium Licking1014_1]
MKIAIVASRFPPEGEIGGIEIASQEISRGLIEKRHDIFVVSSGKKDNIEKTTENIAIYRVSIPNIKFLGNLIFWFKIFFALKKIKPDIIHCQTIQMGAPCFLFKKFYKKPYIVWCHGFDVYFPWKFKKIISEIVLNSADAVIALTNNMKEELQKTCKKNIFVLPNGIDLKKFKGFSKQAIRDKFKIHFNEKIIIFVGGLRPVKGVKYLIEAFKIINKKIPEAKLFLVGDGSERKNLEDIIEKNNLGKKVNFTGKIINQKIPEYMIASDIFVLPSLSEGFPVVILEAMASELPIVTTKVRGLPEIIEDGENGFLVEPKNSEQFAEKVLLLFENDELREKISNNNKEKSKEYDWENIVEKIEKIYLKVFLS